MQPQLFAMVLIAGLAGLGSALIVPLEWGDRARVPATPEFVLMWLIAGLCAIGAAQQAATTAPTSALARPAGRVVTGRELAALLHANQRHEARWFVSCLSSGSGCRHRAR